MAKQSTQENSTEKKPNRVLPIILGVILLGGIIFGIKEYIYYGKHVDTDDAQVDGDISPVVARVGGYVDSIYFQENTHVNKGQVLVKIDDRDYKVKLEQAQAAQVGASSGIGVNESQIYTNEANVSVANANVVSAQARLDKVAKDYARYANLVKDGSITQQQFDQSKSDLEVAQAAVQAAKDQLKAAKEQVGTTKSQLKVTATNIDQRKVDIDYARLQLSYTIIKAPASGITSKKNVQLGQLVQAGQTLFNIVNDSSLYITANFKETQLDKIRNGQKVEIEVDAYPEMKLTGTVYNFSPATGAKFSLLPPDNATGNFVKVVQRVPVKIKINAKPEDISKLSPGMSVNVSVVIKED
jgi:membrane fusion protein (multidrug efflux system)